MRALIISGILLLLLASLVSAQNESNLSDLFSSEGGIMPPSLDEGPGNIPQLPDLPVAGTEDSFAPKAAAEAAANGEGLYNLVLNIRDINTKQPITNAHIRVYLSNGQEQFGTLRFVGEDGSVNLQLPSGTWGITMKLDITETPGKDYYTNFETLLLSNKNLTTFLEPVGSLMGDVLDSEDNLIPNAQIKFECSGDYGETSPLTTDQFGSFSADWLPIGTCKVSALSGKAGSEIVDISHGQSSSVNIILEQGIANGEFDYTWVIIIIVLIVVFSIAFKMGKRKKPFVKEEPKEIRPDRRMEDIISALDQNERRILEFLLQKGGRSIQSNIGRELGFPKSSLSRAIGGLEARHIVNAEKLGRIKRIELSEWFLNGKRPE